MTTIRRTLVFVAAALCVHAAFAEDDAAQPPTVAKWVSNWKAAMTHLCDDARGDLAELDDPVHVASPDDDRASAEDQVEAVCRCAPQGLDAYQAFLRPGIEPDSPEPRYVVAEVLRSCVLRLARAQQPHVCVAASASDEVAACTCVQTHLAALGDEDGGLAAAQAIGLLVARARARIARHEGEADGPHELMEVLSACTRPGAAH